MPKFIVMNKRGATEPAVSAREAVASEPGVTLVNSDNADLITIEATTEVADRLRAKLRATHHVEPAIERSLH